MKISTVTVSIFAICTCCLAGSTLGQTISVAGFNDTNCAILGSPSSQSLPNPNTILQNTCTKIYSFSGGYDLYALANCSEVSSVPQVRVYLYTNPGCTNFTSLNFNTSDICQTVQPPPIYGSYKFICNAVPVNKPFFPKAACSAYNFSWLLSVCAALVFLLEVS
jgi:hypothetical protein